MISDGERHDQGDGEHLPQDNQSERETAVAAAQQLLAGPYVRVPRGALLGLIAALRTSIRVLETILQEGSAYQQPADDDPATG